jgi:hypothetical protein
MTVMNKPVRNLSRPNTPVATTTTEEQRPASAPDATPARITLSTSVAYRGRQLIVTAEGLDADRFCDLLDKRFGAPATAPAAPGVPSCPIHQRPMKLLARADAQGHTYRCTAQVGTGWCDQLA